VFLSLCYVALRWMLQLAALRCQSNEVKDLEIVLLRHELAILQRQIRCPTMTWTDRRFLSGEPTPAAGTMAVLHRHACDAAAMASALGGEALDLHTWSRSPVDST
jgi:hypothetical protein